MAYVGNNLTVQQYAPQIAYFNGTGSVTAFTLPIGVVSGAQIIVAVENVIQNPSSSYSVSGTTLTFTSAPPSGTSNIWVEYTSLQTNTVVPSAGTVGQAQMSSPTGTGVPVLQTSPTLVTPNLGTPSAINLVNATGSILQVAYTSFDGMTTSATAGAPSTITNGRQIFSVSFTPKSATSQLLVQTSAIVIGEEVNSGDKCWLALWDGSTFICANSGTALYTHFASSLNFGCYSLNNAYTSGSTSARTIQVRAGIDGGTAYINGNSSDNYTGSSARVGMTIMEIAG
jgi:hypothetical protein